MACCTFEVSFKDQEAFEIGFAQDSGFPVDYGIVISNAPYHGEYEFTPTDETQTVETAGLVLEQDIIINPIPSNYGKITWNGAVLTVS